MKITTKHKILSVLMSLMMIPALIPAAGFAADDAGEPVPDEVVSAAETVSDPDNEAETPEAEATETEAVPDEQASSSADDPAPVQEETYVGEEQSWAVENPEMQAAQEEKTGQVARALTVINPAVSTHTFVFYVDGEQVYKVILKEDETLNRPANPKKDGAVFAGWFEDEAGTIPFDGFGQTAAMDDTTTKVYAKFEKTCYLRYQDENGHIIRTDRVIEGENYTFRTDDPAFETQAGYINVGWKDQDGTVHKKDENNTITISKDLTLTPTTEMGYTARFFSEGGSPVASQIVLPGGMVDQPSPDPTRVGYTFDGWYTAADGGTSFSFDTAPTSNVKIYAHWKPAQVRYTVAFMVEEAGSDDFTVKATEVRYALSGDSVSYTSADASKYGPTYFRIDTERSQPVVVESDGSTTLKIYYERLKYDFIFNVGSEQYTFSGIKHQQQVDEIYYGIPEIAEHSGSVYPYFAIETGRYLTLIPGIALEHPTLKNYGFNGSRYGQTVVINVEFNNTVKTSVYWYAEYVEGLWPDGTETVPGPDNKEYVLIRSVSWAGNSVWERCYYIEGYSPKYLVRNNSLTEISSSETDYYVSGADNRFYSLVNHRSLQFETNGGAPVADASDVIWGTSLSGYKPDSYVEGELKKQEDGIQYVFAGWYWDSAMYRKADWSADTMPDYNLILYAKWEPIASTVTFDPNGGDLNGSATVKVPTGQPVSQPADPTYTDEQGDAWEFMGWTLEGHAYDFLSPVTDDITLTAQWLDPDANACRVAYDAGEGNGTVTDKGTYTYSSTARVLSDDGITAPVGKHFVYWEDQDGGHYTEGNLLNIKKDLAINDVITLTAAYVPDDTPVSLVYDLNYSHYGKTSPCGYEEDPLTDQLNNSKITLRQPTEEELLKGYTFGGWYLTENANGDPVTEVLIDRNDPTPNKVYAKWVPNEFTITYDLNGGNLNGVTGKIEEVHFYDEVIRILSAPKMEGYDFLYWKGSEYQPGDEYKVTEDHTFTAQWKKKDDPVNPPVDPPVDPDNPGDGGNPPGNGGGAGSIVVADNDVPLAEEEIIDEPVPQAEPEGYWALVNLICTILTVIGAIFLATRRRDDDDEAEDKDEDDEYGTDRRQTICKIAAAATAVASVVTLLLTEDFTLPMHMVDKYTILMVAITALCAVSMFLHSRFDQDEEAVEE